MGRVIATSWSDDWLGNHHPTRKMARSSKPYTCKDPPPQAFFMGYGDSAINFTLFAWPDHFNHWGQVKSDLTAAVYEAVVAAGMSFPFPQREVRVLHEAEAAIAPINAAHKTERADT